MYFKEILLCWDAMKSMRRFTIGSSLVAVLSLTVLITLSAADSASRSKTAGTKPVKAKMTEAQGFGNADSITEEEMKIYDYFLASDQLEGRNLPSRGYDTAALYVASHLAEWGLKPGGSAEGTNGPLQPYLMPFELVTKRAVPEESKASLTGPAFGGRGGRGGRGGWSAHDELRIRQGLDGCRGRTRRPAARGVRCQRGPGLRG